MAGGLMGLDTVLLNLGREIDRIEARTLKGLIRAAIIVRRGTEDVAPKTPVDLGNLRASWFVATSGGESQADNTGFKGENAGKLSSENSQLKQEYAQHAKRKNYPNVIMGYTANYAMAVHENIGAKFKRPGSGAKWLESAIKRNSGEILKVIADEAKIL